MNHRERENIVNSTWGGNHINRPPDDIDEESPEEAIACDECKDMIPYKDYDKNGGLCYFCIMKI